MSCRWIFGFKLGNCTRARSIYLSEPPNLSFCAQRFSSVVEAMGRLWTCSGQAEPVRGARKTAHVRRRRCRVAPDAMGDCRGFGQAFSLSETQPQPFSAGSAGAQKAGDTVAVLERAHASQLRECVRRAARVQGVVYVCTTSLGARRLASGGRLSLPGAGLRASDHTSREWRRFGVGGSSDGCLREESGRRVAWTDGRVHCGGADESWRSKGTAPTFARCRMPGAWEGAEGGRGVRCSSSQVLGWLGGGGGGKCAAGLGRLRGV